MNNLDRPISLEEKIDDAIDFLVIWDSIKKYIFHIISISIAGSILWFFYVSYTEKIYESRSLVQIIDRDLSSNASYESAMFGNRGINADEQVELYLSRSNILSVINQLNLNIFLNDLQLNSNKVEEISVNKMYIDIPTEDLNQRRDYLIVKTNNGFNLLDSQGGMLLNNFPLNTEYRGDNLIINIKELRTEIGAINTLTYYNPSYFVGSVRRSFTVTKVFDARTFIPPSILRITYRGFSEYQNNKIINTANQVFFASSVLFNSKEAKQSIDFINARLVEIKSTLSENEEELKNFKESNITNNVQFEAESLYADLIGLENKLKEIEVQEAEMRSLYKESNPILVSLLSQKDVVQGQVEEINRTISSLPQTQQTYLNLFREVTLSQEIYETLMSAKLEYSIREASTAGNIRIVDDAYSAGKVHPRLGSSLILTLLLSGIIGILYAVLRGVFFSPISLPSELQRRIPSCSLIGIIPREGDLSSNKRKSDSRFKESLKSLSSNISILSGNTKQVLLVTGALKSSGKTYVSINLAKTFSELGKKVLLLDCDFKQGDIHKEFNLKKSKISDLSKDQYKSSVNEVSPNLDVITRPTTASEESISIFSSPTFKEFIDSLKEDYDYVIIDSPPVLAVSDALILSSVTDEIITVVRHNYTKINDHRQLLSDFSMIGLDVINTVYNDFQKPIGYYGYDYYAYKYYGYDYSYEPEE